MRLPRPLPDNPLKWNGWKNFNSSNPYERLCLEFESNPTQEQIDEHWRLLLVWWQKKLPLKNQPSNPMAQVLRIGLDEAAGKLTEARSILSDPAQRAQVDAQVLGAAREAALGEFRKFLTFALTTGKLHEDEEESLYLTGAQLGLPREEMETIIAATLEEKGAHRVRRIDTTEAPTAAAPPPSPAAAPTAAPPTSPAEEFLRMLRLSGIDEMTDDQRDAFCNMGEALGLTGGEAEDVIDDYLDEQMTGTPTSFKPAVRTPVPKKPLPATPKTAAPAPSPLPAAARPQPKAVFVDSPLHRAEEKQRFPPFRNGCGMEMRLINSGSFLMGSNLPDAAANEQPVTPTKISAFYMARTPVTNAQYEAFAPEHRAKRTPWADDHHPVVYVSAKEAEAFCQWLSQREGKRYRLPTEAEWEYAARGPANLTYPWGDAPPTGREANFADASTSFPWADRTVTDGYAQSSPVGAFPKGASPFGLDDMAGNVWEWCLDGLSAYTGRERINPRGPQESPRRICRGGSWKARLNSLRASARAFNAPQLSAHDIGFRVVCEIAG